MTEKARRGRPRGCGAKPLSEAEKAQLVALRGAGLGWPRIAAIMGRGKETLKAEYEALAVDEFVKSASEAA